jgi:hypothetical protein
LSDQSLRLLRPNQQDSVCKRNSTKGRLSAGDKTAIGVLVLVVVIDFLHRRRSELTGENEAQKGKDVTLIEMPNEALNEIHADNDSPVEMLVSEPRSVQLHAGGAAPPIEMPPPSLVIKKSLLH